MTSEVFRHFVFVDFENVPKVDLGLVEGRPIHVTLLIGKKQTKLDLSLVHQIHRMHSQVKLVEVGASGHNALDLNLAFYLGRAVEKYPAAQFSIVSKDKDFNPLVDHLAASATQVSRHETFAGVFHPSTRKALPAKPAAPGKAAAPAADTAASVDERFEKLITRLRDNTAPRPKKKSSLLAHINTVAGGKLGEAEQSDKLTALIARGILTLDDKERVKYL